MNKKSVNKVLLALSLCLFCLCTFIDGVEALSLTSVVAPIVPLKGGSTQKSDEGVSVLGKNYSARSVMIASGIFLVIFIGSITAIIVAGEMNQSVHTSDYIGTEAEQEAAFLDGFQDGWNIGHAENFDDGQYDSWVGDSYEIDAWAADRAYDAFGDGHADEVMWKAGFLEATDRYHYDVDGAWNPDSSHNYHLDIFQQGRDYAINRWQLH